MHPSRTLGEKLAPIPYLLPAVISVAVLSFLPIGYTIYYSFTNYSGQHLFKYNWVGLQNYLQLITGPSSNAFFPILAWTVVFAVLSVVTQYTMGLGLAVLLSNKHMKERNLYRALLILPWALPATIMIMSFKALFNASYGQVNYVLAKVMEVGPFPWLDAPAWARLTVILVNLWFGFPWFMTVLLGGLQSIPNELYEAAEIDGASRWEQFRQITLPILWSVSLPVVVASAAFNFNNFGAAYLLTNGGPPRTTATWGGYTDILASVTFKLTHDSYLYGLASALSVLLFLLVAGFSLVNLKLTRAFEEME